MDRRMRITLSLSGIVGFFLAIAPVFDPYVFMEMGGVTIKINDLIMIVLLVFCLAKSTRFDRRTNFLCVWVYLLGIVSIMGNLCSDTNLVMSIKNLVVWFVFAICLTYIWEIDCRDYFFCWIERIAILVSILVIFQFLFGNIGIPIWDGRMPGLELGKYDAWAGYIDRNTGDIRPNGLFQEASYLGIYVSVAYAHAFKEEKIKKMLLYASAMLLTTSMVAVILCSLITLYYLIERKKIDMSSKMFRRILLVIVLAVVGCVILIQVSESVGETFSYILKRINNFESDLAGDRMSSTKYRLLGHITLFEQYNGLQKFCGVGAGQYSSYFGVTSYSNVWVTTLLNYGILGISVLLLSVISFIRKVDRKNLVYVLIFVLVLSSDYQWFSWYFFYLISACILTDNSVEIQPNNIKIKRNVCCE